MTNCNDILTFTTNHIRMIDKSKYIWGGLNFGKNMYFYNTFSTFFEKTILLLLIY